MHRDLAGLIAGVTYFEARAGCGGETEPPPAVRNFRNSTSAFCFNVNGRQGQGCAGGGVLDQALDLPLLGSRLPDGAKATDKKDEMDNATEKPVTSTNFTCLY
jgi:hypothetical protein